MLQRGGGGGGGGIGSGYYTREPGNYWSSDSLAKAYIDIVTNMRSNGRNVSDGRNLINVVNHGLCSYRQRYASSQCSKFVLDSLGYARARECTTNFDHWSDTLLISVHTYPFCAS